MKKKTAKGWRKIFRLNRDNPKWLHDNAPKLLRDVKTALESSGKLAERQEFVQLLGEMRNYVSAFPDPEEWTKVYVKALDVPLPEDNPEDEEAADPITAYQLHNTIGGLYLQTGHYEMAQPHFHAAFELTCSFPEWHPDQLDAKVGIVIVEAYLQPGGLNLLLTSQLLEQYASRRQTQLSIRLRQALAFASYYWNEYDRGIEWGHQAYTSWKTQENDLEMGRAAYILASLYRAKDDLDSADNWLRTALELYQKTNYKWGYATVANEIGSLALYEGVFTEAVRWHRIALAAVQPLGNAYRIALVRMCLANALIYEERNLDEAETILDEAIHDANHLDAGHDLIVHIYHMRSFLEWKRGSHQKALEILEKGMELTLKRPAGEFRDGMLRKYQEMMAAIRNNHNPDWQGPWFPSKQAVRSNRSGLYKSV